MVTSDKKQPDAERTKGGARFSKTAIVVPVAILVIIGLPVVYFSYLLKNRAAELVSPLGKELVENGATKLCDSGDPGRGPDNTAPWYRAYYDLSMSKDAAISLVNMAASHNGYTLTHASPTNRGHLSAVADIYIDRWYFDDTSKQNPYSDIQPGPIELAVVVGDPGAKKSCDPTKTVDAGHEEVGIEVKLPEFKH